MKEQRVLITDSSYDVNSYLEKGWEIISVTASHKTYNCFCFVIQKQQ